VFYVFCFVLFCSPLISALWPQQHRTQTNPPFSVLLSSICQIRNAVYIQTSVANGPTELITRQSAMHNRQRRHGVTDLDNALGGSYNHPQHGSRPRVSDQQLFTYMAIVLTALLLLLLLHPNSPSRDRDRQAAKRLRRCSSLPERTASSRTH
jgi:hypothetical protein